MHNTYLGALCIALEMSIPTQIDVVDKKWKKPVNFAEFRDDITSHQWHHTFHFQNADTSELFPAVWKLRSRINSTWWDDQYMLDHSGVKKHWREHWLNEMEMNDLIVVQIRKLSQGVVLAWSDSLTLITHLTVLNTGFLVILTCICNFIVNVQIWIFCSRKFDSVIDQIKFHCLKDWWMTVLEMCL